MVALYCSEAFGVESYRHVIEPEYAVPAELEAKAESDLSRMLEGEPVQYVLGVSWFCGRKFRVSPSVLIPRPETEQLVELAMHGLHSGSRVLDICTGSGCIAWSIFLDTPGTSVFGLDISEQALEIARNQFPERAPEFFRADILDSSRIRTDEPFDLIVSNPPYILESEKTAMRRNVLDYEPGIALFVPDDDPLVFYRAIAQKASTLLKDGGRGIVEINESLADGTTGIFVDSGFDGITVHKDFFNKPRFVEFRKPKAD